jgi:small conductance mechanosensitive channel
VWGLESISGDALVIRLVIKTRANAKDDVARELRMRLKHAMDDLGIRLPALTTIMPSGIEGAQRVRGANPPKTKPTAVTPESTSRAVWKPKRPPKASPPPATDATGHDSGAPRQESP